jgi:hypothetical protein
MARVRRRRLNREVDDEHPYIKEESPDAPAVVDEHVEIKEESPSPTPIPEAEVQPTLQPEVKTEPIEEESSLSPVPEQAAEDEEMSQPEQQSVLSAQAQDALQNAPLIDLRLALQTRQVDKREWIAAGSLVQPARYSGLNLSSKDEALRWRDVARSAYQRTSKQWKTQKRADMLAQQQSGQQQTTVVPPPRMLPTNPSKLKKLKLKLQTLAPLIALHIASQQRTVADQEWVAVRQQVKPAGGWGKSPLTIVEHMQSVARNAYSDRQRLDAGEEQAGRVYNTRSGLH